MNTTLVSGICLTYKVFRGIRERIQRDMKSLQLYLFIGSQDSIMPHKAKQFDVNTTVLETLRTKPNFFSLSIAVTFQSTNNLSHNRPKEKYNLSCTLQN